MMNALFIYFISEQLGFFTNKIAFFHNSDTLRRTVILKPRIIVTDIIIIFHILINGFGIILMPLFEYMNRKK